MCSWQGWRAHGGAWAALKSCSTCKQTKDVTSAQAGLPAAAWAEVPFDIMREVVGRLPPHDVQTALLVCREWRDGFTNGVAALRPRVLRPQQLAERCARPG